MRCTPPLHHPNQKVQPTSHLLSSSWLLLLAAVSWMLPRAGSSRARWSWTLRGRFELCTGLFKRKKRPWMPWLMRRTAKKYERRKKTKSVNITARLDAPEPRSTHQMSDVSTEVQKATRFLCLLLTPVLLFSFLLVLMALFPRTSSFPALFFSFVPR